jgi:hypothetical protein
MKNIYIKYVEENQHRVVNCDSLYICRWNQATAHKDLVVAMATQTAEQRFTRPLCYFAMSSMRTCRSQPKACIAKNVTQKQQEER